MAKARGNGSGSVTAHGSGWRLRWTLENGSRRSKVIRGGTKRQAEAILRDILSAVAAGTWADPRDAKREPESKRFADFARDYLRVREPDVAVGTFRNWGSLLRTTLLPTFGDLDLDEITRRAVDVWWSSRAAHPVNRRNAYFLLRSMFNVAMDWELVDVSPCRIRDAGKDVSIKRPDWTVADFDALLAHVPPFYVAPLEVLFAGHMRLGELVALDGSDYRDGYVTVTKQRTKEGVTTGTKTDQTKRIKLLERGVMAMSSRPRVIGSAPLFAGERAERITRLAIRNAWVRACAAGGRVDFHLHDLRHISLSLIAEVAPLKVVQQRAGHASPTSTQRYMHADVRQHEEAVARADALLRRIS